MDKPPENTENIVAIIPARGGSKRIEGKNLRLLGGKPVVVHSIEHALQSRSVTEVIVSTEDSQIARVSEASGARVVYRPPHLTSDEACSESALLHALDVRVASGLRDPDLVVFLQCTSPVRQLTDIDAAVATLQEADADSLFSACLNNRLIWAVNDTGPFALTYDYKKRQREQEMAKQYRENGSVYVFKPEILRRLNNRLGGKIAIYEMDYWSSFQIDEPEHFELIEWILEKNRTRRASVWPPRIDLVVLDFDGVMTENTVIVREDGTEAVICHRGDGWGIARLQEVGVPIIVLSTECNGVVGSRCGKLRIPCHQGVKDKGKFLVDYLSKQQIRREHVIYLGNDVNDLEAMQAVGFPVSVADGHPDVLKAARLVLRTVGGRGAVRELCDLVRSRISSQDNKSVPA